MKKLLSFLLVSVLSLVVAIPAFASDGENRSDMRFGEGSHKELRKASQNLDATQLACVKTAVDKRETAVDTAVSAFTASVNTAYSTRKTALSAAWALTDATARREAVKAAWSAFKDSVKVARKTLKDARKESWKTFRAEAKACGASSSIESEGSDNI